MTQASSLQEYLAQCCDEYDFLGCVVADGDGLMLAMSGEDMRDEFIAHLSGWLSSGRKISELGGMGDHAAVLSLVIRPQSCWLGALIAIMINTFILRH
jgi:hypothetical protein